MNVLLIADDAPSGRRMRAIGRVLESAGHRVSVFDRPTALADRQDAAGTDVRPRWTADAVVAGPWKLPVSAFLRRHALIIDGVSIRPAELDTTAAGDRESHRRTLRSERRAQLVAARADAVLVAGEAQRRWWSDRLGPREPPLVDLPSGIPDDDPDSDTPDVPGVPPSWSVVMWWGGAAPSVDLDTLLAARALLGGATVSVVVPTYEPSDGSAPSPSATDVMDRASAHGLRPPQVVALARRTSDDGPQRALPRAAVTVVLHHPGPEAELAFRASVLDGLWADTPLLVTEGGAMSDVVRSGGWGAVVPPREPRSTAAALELLLRDRTRSRCREAMARDRERWRWSRVARPIVDLLPRLPAVSRSGIAATALRVALGPWRSGGRAT